MSHFLALYCNNSKYFILLFQVREIKLYETKLSMNEEKKCDSKNPGRATRGSRLKQLNHGTLALHNKSSE